MLNTSCPYYESKCVSCPCIKYQAYKDVQDASIVANELNELGIDDTLDSWNKIFSIQKHFAARFSDVNNVTKEWKIREGWER